MAVHTTSYGNSGSTTNWGSMGLGAMGIGSLLGAFNSYYSTKLQNKSLKYQAAAARNNAKLARMQSESALKHGERASQQIMTAAAKQKGAQKTGYAANGVDISSRSAQNIMNETDYQAQSDQIQTEANALAQAWSYRLQATNYENQAKIAKSQMQSPIGAALGSLIGGALGIGVKYGDDLFGGSDSQNNVTLKRIDDTDRSGFSTSLMSSATASGFSIGGNYSPSILGQFNPQYWTFDRRW